MTYESIDEKIIRLKNELAMAEYEKLAEELDKRTGQFLLLTDSGDTENNIRIAIELLDEAWAKFQERRQVSITEEPPPKLIEAQTKNTKPERKRRDPKTYPCGYCGEPGHNIRSCPTLYDRTKKNPDAVALGKRGGVKGGIARAKALSSEQRTAIASKAAKVRWNKTDQFENIPPTVDSSGEPIGDAWSDPDEEGKQTCKVCNGEGIDRREGGSSCCLHCDGEGVRYLAKKSAVEEKSNIMGQ